MHVSKQMVVVNPATPSLNGQLVTVQDRVHELIVQLRGEQKTSQRLSLELEAARTALDEANKRLLETATNKPPQNQEGNSQCFLFDKITSFNTLITFIK